MLPLMIAKLITGVSDAVPEADQNVMLKLPVATAVTNATYLFVAVFTDRTTVSVSATAVFVTVNVAGVDEPAAVNSVMAPVGLLRVTPVVRLVA